MSVPRFSQGDLCSDFLLHKHCSRWCGSCWQVALVFVSLALGDIMSCMLNVTTHGFSEDLVFY